MQKKVLACVMVMCLAVLAGCGSKDVQSDTRLTVEIKKMRTLDSCFDLEKVQISEDSHGQQKFIIPVENSCSSAESLRYRIDWFDGSGFPIRTAMSYWKKEVLIGEDKMYITGVCPTAFCAKAVLSLGGMD